MHSVVVEAIASGSVLIYHALLMVDSTSQLGRVAALAHCSIVSLHTVGYACEMSTLNSALK
jgi:hypothetical protein